MNTKAYIQSGILELYALEALPPAQIREVEAWATQYPEIQSEIERIQEAINAYALLHTEAPRSELKQEILTKVQARPKNIALAGSRRNWLSIAALVIAAIASVLAFTCYTHSRSLEQQLNDVLSENEILKRTSNTAVAQINFINNPDTKTVVLGEAAAVYWNRTQQTTLLAIKNLPPPPPGKQYQLWSIEGNNPAKSAGLIDYDPIRLQEMTAVAIANVFAISLENEGGSAQPTQVVVIGTVS